MIMNDGRNLTKSRAEALATFLHLLRSDWDEPGIVHALGKARDRGDAYLIGVAAIRCAAEPTNRTPAVIALDGQHWRPRSDDEPEPTPSQPSVADMRCRHCGRWRVRGEDHDCAIPVAADEAHRLADAARAMIKARETA